MQAQALDAPLWRALETPLRGLDVLRRGLLRLFGPTAAVLWRDRERRVALAGSLAVLLSLTLTCAAPLWLLCLGPLLLGVPHLVADLRYLVLRPGLHRRPALALCLVPLGLLAVTTRVELGLPVLVVAVLVARGPLARRLPVLAAALALCAVAALRPVATTLWLAQAHNFVAVGLFLWWRRRGRHRTARFAVSTAPAALTVVGSAALLLGLAEPVLLHTGGFAAPAGVDLGVDLGVMADTLAPGLPAVLAQRLVLLFAFAQSVHYGLWLRLIPDEDRPREAPRSFVSSLRALRADLGGPLVLLALAAAVALALWGAHDPGAARDGYLRVAASHGYLELGAIALCLCEGRRPGDAAT